MSGPVVELTDFTWALTKVAAKKQGCSCEPRRGVVWDAGDQISRAELIHAEPCLLHTSRASVLDSGRGK